MKKIKTLVHATVAAFALAASASAIAQVTLRLAHYAEATHPANQAAMQFAQKVEARTAGKVKVSINQTYALKDAAQAHRDLEARKTTGSTVLLP